MRARFIGIGFQKCGTTTLYELLRHHRELILTQDVKEPMFYRVGWWREKKGAQWYEKRYFGGYPENDARLPGEINAGLGENGCAEWIAKDFAADTKLIFMMREPVERSYSAYKYFLARGFLPMRYMRLDRRRGHAAAFDVYVHNILEHPGKKAEILKKRRKYLVFSQSCYAELIGEYAQYFPKEQMHFILFEDFVKNQEKECRKVYDFLGIGEDEKVPYGIRSNEGNQRAAGSVWAILHLWFVAFNYWLTEYLDVEKDHPVAYRRYRIVHDWVIRKSFQEDEDHSKVTDSTRQYLQQYYQQEIAQTEKLIGRSLEGIWYGK